MPRIPYVDPAQLSDAVRKHLGESPPNVSRMMAVASEGVFTAYSRFGAAFLRGSPLPGKLRELAILRVGYLSDSAYETFQHEALGRYEGLNDDQIAAIKAGDVASPALNNTERAVLAFVDDVVANVRASDETLAAVREHLSDTEVVDLTFVTGCYMMVSRVLETTGVEIEENPIDWAAFMRGGPVSAAKS